MVCVDIEQIGLDSTPNGENNSCMIVEHVDFGLNFTL